ncbi:yecA family protein [Burkholderiales bacterium JOSHI_001]|nr:yecA family protein [Burkholderiales bacterium JOSHI_001]
MEYPDYDPQYDTPPLSDEELAELDAVLAALPSDNPMNVEAMDGYLTALLLQPGRAQPPRSADWLPAVWGGDGEGAAPFVSGRQRKKAAQWVLRHLHAIDLQLQRAPQHWQPVFSIAEVPGADGADGDEWVDAEDWCIGFLQAVALDAQAWGPVFDDADLGPLMVPLAVLGGEDSGLSEADAARLADPPQRDELSRAVVDAVLALQARRLPTPT